MEGKEAGARISDRVSPRICRNCLEDIPPRSHDFRIVLFWVYVQHAGLYMNAGPR